MTFRITLETDVVSRGLRRGNPHVKMSFHFRGLSPSPRNFRNAFQSTFTLLPMFVLYRYDEFPHYYMAIEIFQVLVIIYCK